MAITRRQLIRSGLSALALCSLGASAASSPPPSQAGRDPTPAGRGPRNRRTLLILGGTKFLGPALVREAMGRGITVTLFNRGKTNPGLFPEVEKLRGDRDGKLDALRGRRWDAVIDDSGYVPRVVRMSAELLAPSVGRYLFVSSISVYRDGLPRGSDETAPLQALADPATEDVGEHYGALKVACEKVVEDVLPGRAAIVRPTVIAGPEDPTDRFTYWPARMDRGGEVLAPGDGDDPVQLVDVRDLAAFMIGLVEQEATGTYNAAGPERTLTARALLEACRAAAGGKATLTWVPWPFLEKAEVAPWAELPLWLPRQVPDSAMTTLSSARAIARGLRFRPVGDTARDTLAWWRGLPPERRAKLGAGLAPDEERAVLERWRAARKG